MPLDSTETRAIVEKFGEHEEDTGSPSVQVALLTARIEELTDHFREHPQDHNGRRGLLKLVGRRRRLLDYLRKDDVEEYRRVVDELGLRR